MDITIRKATSDDLHSILDVFISAISAVKESAYSNNQKKAWQTSVQNHDKWLNRIRNQYFMICELDKQIIGFASIDHKNYLDVLFVDPKFHRKGIASSLYKHIENQARKSDLDYIETHSSLVALDFFQRKGFTLIKEQEVQIQDQRLTNYILRKDL